MRNVEIGKLYCCEKYFLFLYPDKESAKEVSMPATDGIQDSKDRFKLLPSYYWTEIAGKKILTMDKNHFFLVLSTEESYIEVLVGKQKGWIINSEFEVFALKEFHG